MHSGEGYIGSGGTTVVSLMSGASLGLLFWHFWPSHTSATSKWTNHRVQTSIKPRLASHLLISNWPKQITCLLIDCGRGLYRDIGLIVPYIDSSGVWIIRDNYHHNLPKLQLQNFKESHKDKNFNIKNSKIAE